MDLKSAAAYLGMTEAQIIRSRQRGLPPGKLAYTVDGKLYFDPSVLLPPPTPNSIAANPEKAAEMVQAVGRDLTASPQPADVAPRGPQDGSGPTKADLLEEAKDWGVDAKEWWTKDRIEAAIKEAVMDWEISQPVDEGPEED